MVPQELAHPNPIETEIAKYKDILFGHVNAVMIDGPASAGKGTLAHNLASELGLTVIETGEMYRALTALILDVSNDDPESIDEATIREWLSGLKIKLKSGRDRQTVLLNHSSFDQPYDVTRRLYEPDVQNAVSGVASHNLIRDFVDRQAKEMLEQGGCVIEGRDMWQYELPESPPDKIPATRVYIWASDEKLAARETDRQRKRNKNISPEEALAGVVARNEADFTRANRGRLLRPMEAKSSGYYDTVIDTTDMDEFGGREVLLEVMKVMAKK